MSEQDRLDLLRRVLTRGRPSTAVDIGDDAAVLHSSGAAVVASVDVQVEGVHFDRRWLSLMDVGYRASVAAFSDLAAMGALPLGALSSLILPADFSDAELSELATGQARACDELSTAMVGGNLSAGAQLSLTTTVLGSCSTPLLRSGARPGDDLLLAGELGLAAAGLLALQQGADSTPALLPALASWRRPRAHLQVGALAASLAHAGIDISDGLALDAARLARQSGCCLLLDADALTGEALLAAAAQLGVAASELALHGGEDYALLLAVPAGSAVAGARRIGQCLPSQSAAAGVAEPGTIWIEQAGERRLIEPRGFDHFAPSAF